MKTFSLFLCIFLIFSAPTFAKYERNKAVPVQQVLFGKVKSVRNISEQQLVHDKSNGWKTFGGALLGGVIGNQFGGGSGRTVATILGSMIGGNVAHNQQQTQRYENTQLVELLIQVESGKQFMVIQDSDPAMRFHQGDNVRLIYLTDNTVRVDSTF